MTKKEASTNAVPPGRDPLPRSSDPNFLEYPKMLYYLGNPTNYQIVNSAEEEAAVGPKWYDRPLEVPDPEPEGAAV